MTNQNSPDHGARSNALTAAGALGPVLPEEILATEDLVVLDEAFVSERLGARCTGETLGVPGLVHHLQDEPVQDHAGTGTTLGNGRCNRRNGLKGE